MKPYTDDVARDACSKGIQDILDQINFPTTADAGKTLGCLLMLTVRAMDGLMGHDYAVATILQVMEQMATGNPQKQTKIELINRSKLN